MPAKLTSHADWVPSACTLPTTEQPVRIAQFDDLFRKAVSGVDQPSSGNVRLTLHPSPQNAARAARLAAMESSCCAFFSFDLAIANGELTLSVVARPAHEQILNAFAVRARNEAGVPT
jgi:hypothetical protein